MAKTRKAVGGASRARGTKKTSSRRQRAGTRRRGDGELDLRPLKKQIRKHIETLSAVERPGGRTRAALKSLRRVQRDLTKACLPTMVIGFP